MSSVADHYSKPASKISVYKTFGNKKKKLKSSNKADKELTKMLGKMSLNHLPGEKTKPLGGACRKGHARGQRRQILVTFKKKKKNPGDGFNRHNITRLLKSRVFELASQLLISETPSTSETFTPQNTKTNIIHPTESLTSKDLERETPTDVSEFSPSQPLNPKTSHETSLPHLSRTLLLQDSEPEKVSSIDIQEPSLTKRTYLSMKGIPFFPTRGTSLQRHPRTQSSLKTNLKFTEYMNKRVVTKIVGDCWVEGTLRGYDDFMNLVLEDSVELRRSGDRIDVGVSVIRGRSIVMVEEITEDIPPEVFRRRPHFYERIPVSTFL